MNWAWLQVLSPSSKLVLMALADAADDQGICWPSVPTLARKCSVSPRTVQRVLKALTEQQLLVSEQRHRPDGSCSSNRYRLGLTGGDNLSRAPVTRVTTPRQPCQGALDTGVTPGTTIGTVIESPQLPTAPQSSMDDSRGGQDPALEYPKSLSPSERTVVEKQLVRFPTDVAQQLLDELAARLAAGAVHTSPIAYLRGMIKRAANGTFTPEGALRVADARRRARQIDAMRDAADRNVTMAAVNENDPLVRRLRAIQKKARTSRKD